MAVVTLLVDPILTPGGVKSAVGLPDGLSVAGGSTRTGTLEFGSLCPCSVVRYLRCMS